ncbi:MULTISPECIES: calcium/sodium antiporter [unclassified Clostridioides]|uniref:calcium/sodium antiporter n=1 Tax=unclassified Clostridioides TaxID=2635829 RepID=UPI0006BBCCAC|nr:sodium:calcium antiporter [Clostridioides difficile]MCC0692109.1 calcium/sodium antiporter [Clostridioides sp. ZZV14-6387]KPI54912.1 sodium:calcium antiporter [Clostridioides difficile]MDB3083881.1 sodium:calcium antiporter [Clostridioides difficile]MDI7816187.1 calcium/sodium antiporter [Clostridioides difficile]
MFITVILFLVGFLLITKGADIFINCTVEIGRKTNISEIILGATIVSFATTLPEFTVSLLASIDGHTTMSLGNAVGSIICNTGLALGLVVFISPYNVDKKMFFSKSLLLIVSVIVLILLGLDGVITRGDSLLLIIILIFYMVNNYRSVVGKSTKNRNIKNSTIKDIPTKKSKNFRGFSVVEILKILALFATGLIMMIIGSQILIESGVRIASFLNIPQGIVSLTIIALGTSLPEIVSSITAIRKNHHEISVGNILGANILNIVSVIAVSAIPNNIPILSQNRQLDIPFMILLLLIVIVPTLKSNRLSRIQGILMLFTYFLYISILYFMYII